MLIGLPVTVQTTLLALLQQSVVHCVHWLSMPHTPAKSHWLKIINNINRSRPFGPSMFLIFQENSLIPLCHIWFMSVPFCAKLYDLSQGNKPIFFCGGFRAHGLERGQSGCIPPSLHRPQPWIAFTKVLVCCAADTNSINVVTLERRITVAVCLNNVVTFLQIVSVTIQEPATAQGVIPRGICGRSSGFTTVPWINLGASLDLWAFSIVDIFVRSVGLQPTILQELHNIWNWSFTVDHVGFQHWSCGGQQQWLRQGSGTALEGTGRHQGLHSARLNRIKASNLHVSSWDHCSQWDAFLKHHPRFISVGIN